MKIHTHLLFSLALLTSCFAGEVVKFDKDKPIKEMLQVIKNEIRKGETKTVKFSVGEFHLVRPVENDGRNLQITKPAQPLTVELASGTSLQEIKEWCESSEVKWVHIRIDLDAKSELFFKLEEQLRSKGVQYILSSVDAKKDGFVTLEHIPGPPMVPTVPR